MSLKAKDLLLEEIRKTLLEAAAVLKAENFSEEEIYSLRVGFHRIKGGAGFLQMKEIEGAAGALESHCSSPVEPARLRALLWELKSALDSQT